MESDPRLGIRLVIRILLLTGSMMVQQLEEELDEQLEHLKVGN
jgi:hypothetical protein